MTPPLQITKFRHSCLRFSQQGQYLLFDPGTLAFRDPRVRPEVFSDIQAIVITHNHPDHLDPDAVQAIQHLSGATIIGNSEVAKALADRDLSVQVHEAGPLEVAGFRLQAIPVQHEAILDDHLPQTTAYLINERVLNVADAFDPVLLAHAGIEVAVLPVMAPFLTELGVLAFAKQLRPRQVIPVHDGFAEDDIVQQRYETYRPYLAQAGMTFHELAVPGASVTL